METFILDLASIKERRGYAVHITEFESRTAEQRRKVRSKPIIGFQLESPNLTTAGVLAYENFYDTVDGETDAFTWVSTRTSVSYTVRFEGEMNIVYDKGICVARFAFKVVDSEETGG